MTRQGAVQQAAQEQGRFGQLSQEEVEGAIAVNPSMQQRDQAFDAAQPRSLGQTVSDAAGQLGIGVRQIAGTPASLAAPGSDMAQRNQQWTQDATANLSPQTRANIAQADERIKQAADQGLWEEVKAVGSEYFTNPVLMQHFAVTTLPSMIGVLGPAKAAQAYVMMRGGSAAAAATAGKLTAGWANAAMTAGDARQNAYDDLLQTYLKAGMTRAEAESRAAQESIVSAGVGGVFGFVGGRYGAESAMLGGTAGKTAGSRALAAFLGELGTEIPEELAPLVTTNLIAGQTDNRSALQNVPATAGQTLIGAGPIGDRGRNWRSGATDRRRLGRARPEQLGDRLAVLDGRRSSRSRFAFSR